MDRTTTATISEGTEGRSPKKPPSWFVHLAWRIHRVLHRLSGGRFLWTTTNKRGWGALVLTTTGRTSGQERKVIIGYIEDGPNLVAIAMNGWDEGHPAWWRNLQANPFASVRLARQDPRTVHAREATGDELNRLWQRWLDTDPELTAHAAHRSTETPSSSSSRELERCLRSSRSRIRPRRSTRAVGEEQQPGLHEGGRHRTRSESTQRDPPCLAAGGARSRRDRRQPGSSPTRAVGQLTRMPSP